MQIHLHEISRRVAPGALDDVLMDRAGWHTTGELILPDNISLRFLPSRAPELNPVENIWQFLRQTYLSNRVFEIPLRMPNARDHRAIDPELAG